MATQKNQGPVHESFRGLKKALLNAGMTEKKPKSKVKRSTSPKPKAKKGSNYQDVRRATLKKMNDPKYRSKKPADPRNKKRTVSKSSGQVNAAKRVLRKSIASSQRVKSSRVMASRLKATKR
jgi:hypothetical protein